MSDLIKYIAAENQHAKDRMANEPGTYIGLLSEDAAWWADYKVYTVDQFKRWEIEVVMSDLAKEAYGTRRACPDTSNMSFDELKAEYDRMCEIANDNYEAEMAEQALAVKAFEKQIKSTIELGASDRETAVRWLQDNDEFMGSGDGYFEFCNNLPYGYLAKAA